MLRGLQGVLGASELVAVVNTADDFDLYGMHVMPDIDSVLYTLAGLNDEQRGWGQAGESWNFMEALRTLGEDGWFSLGDRDLATHVLRTQWLREGASFAQVTQRLCTRMGVAGSVYPMSNEPVATQLRCNEQWVSFQDYFVRKRCEPVVSATRLVGVDGASPLPEWFEPLRRNAFDAIVVCPSNPLLSIHPILELPGVRAALREFNGPVVAVSPLIGGASVKGPAAKLMRELGCEVSCVGIAATYEGLLDGMLIDATDVDQAPRLQARGLVVGSGDILMTGDEGRERVARLALELVKKVGARRDR
jgi:LPPG:FO 2-phospho-L-lactate transferase